MQRRGPMKQGEGKKPKTLVIFHLAFFIFHLCLIGSVLNCPDGGLELAVRGCRNPAFARLNMVPQW